MRLCLFLVEMHQNVTFFSPVIYSYYWSVRPWGVCSCWEEELAAEGSLDLEDDSERLSERLCVGALDARARQETKVLLELLLKLIVLV